MKDYFLISTEGHYFSLFYNLAFLIALVLLLYEGHIRKFPMMKWVLLVLLSMFFFIIGTKIITYTPGEWDLFFKTFILPPAPKKSLIGGLLLGGAGLTAGKYILRFRQNFLDAFAVVLPLAIAIQRVGCFLTGCCYGKISTVPWAVSYPGYALPHYHHYQSGLITSFDYSSLPVHPVQLYELIGLIAGVLLLVYLRKHLKAKGSMFWYSMILIVMVRFITEFFRDPLAHTVGSEVIWILNTTQMAILPVSLLLILILVKMESRTEPQNGNHEKRDLGMAHSFWFLLSMSAVLWSARNWFTYPEMLALAINLFVAITLMGSRLIRNFYYSPYRWLYLASLFIPIVIMAQTVPEYSRDLWRVKTKTYKSISAGFGSGRFNNYNQVGGDCDGYSREYFEQKYTLTGAGYYITREIPDFNEKMTYGLNVFGGQHIETRLSENTKKNHLLFGISPYISYDRKWAGIGGGVHFGELRYITENYRVSTFPRSASKFTQVYPRLYARVGPQNIFFVDYRLANQFPSALPGFRHQLGIGTGFGSESGVQVRFGSTFGTTSFNIPVTFHRYLAGYFPIENKIVIEPVILWGQRPENAPSYVNAGQFQFSLGLSYRFDYREEKK